MSKREALARELASAQAAIAPARAAIANIEARLGELNRREVAIVREISGILLETFEAETEGDIADFAEAVGEHNIALSQLCGRRDFYLTNAEFLQRQPDGHGAAMPWFGALESLTKRVRIPPTLPDDKDAIAAATALQNKFATLIA
jgi:hypothetical protein